MGGKSLDDLAPFARELAVASLDWSEQFWDGEAGLLALGPDFKTAHRNVRNSIWFALGLLLRNGDGDVARAVQVIGAVLDNQFDEPGTIYHGTFYRYVGESHPPENPITWRDFDPNWRQFIGTTLAIILEEYAERLPGELVKRVDRAIQLAVEGEPPDRCAPSYTNIALMKAGLMTWAGDRYGPLEGSRDGEAFGGAVYDLFTAHGTFDEYNSPTYYGVNFYALAFWRLYSHSEMLVKYGAEIEAEVWRDVAQYYHAGLKNVCGPFTRSYGMDMPEYGALLGMSIWLGVGRDVAPFPKSESYFDHGSDFCYGPCFGMVDTIIPEGVLPHFKIFSGERFIEKRISTTPDRIATSWLGEKIMIGAEATPLDGSAEKTYYKMSNQFHPATIHWEMPDGNVAWLRLRHLGVVNARAKKGYLTVAGKMEQALVEKYGDDHMQFVFEIQVPGGVDIENVQANQWDLPGLSMRVESNVVDPSAEQDGDRMNVIYTVTDLDVEPQFTFVIQ